jgi:MFS family permease
MAVHLVADNGELDRYSHPNTLKPSIRTNLVTGITAVTAYSPVLLKQAGYSAIKQNGLAGGLNTIGIIGTIISAQVVDRFGRRQCLMWGAAGLFIVNLIVSIIPSQKLLLVPN